MKRPLVALLAALALPAAGALPTAVAHDDPPGRPTTYVLDGDDGGSRFEGIGTDQRRGTFYVSEVTGGEIHRGTANRAHTSEWLAGDGADGRFTARGITTDRQGNVYIAGGPNGIGPDGRDNGRPDVWVYSRSGQLLAALQVPGDNAFLNDVWIGPDGAAYVTNSNAPQVFRVVREHGSWTVELWVDATGTIPTVQGPGQFNLGGIVTSPDRSALIVAQGNLGRLWRLDLQERSVTQVDTGGVDLVGADGLVLRGNRLTVVRNFPRVVTTLRLSADGSDARLLSEQATDPERVLTTAKVLNGRILYVDSKFDEAVATPPYEVVTDPFVR